MLNKLLDGSEEKNKFPIHKDVIDGEVYRIGYKVLFPTDHKKKFTSLGLRRNPNVLEFTVGKWFILSEDKIRLNSKDWGGIWMARIPSEARRLQKYVKRKYDKITYVFKTAFDQLLYYNYRSIKTNAVLLYQELRK